MLSLTVENFIPKSCTVQQASDQKSQMISGMTAAMQELAGDAGLKDALASTEPDRQKIIKQGPLIDEHKSALAQTAELASFVGANSRGATWTCPCSMHMPAFLSDGPPCRCACLGQSMF